MVWMIFGSLVMSSLKTLQMKRLKSPSCLHPSRHPRRCSGFFRSEFSFLCWVALSDTGREFLDDLCIGLYGIYMDLQLQTHL